MTERNEKNIDDMYLYVVCVYLNVSVMVNVYLCDCVRMGACVMYAYVN